MIERSVGVNGTLCVVAMFITPTIVNGKLFVSTPTDVAVFGLR